MRQPPDPLYSLTIPSVHDDTALDCRIYHPHTLNNVGSSSLQEGTSCRAKGIVMAHPYAPMGGSYDDRVVGIVVDEFLKAGWIVGTFNFRGAHVSKGRTSWSGRPELDDYTSFAAFFMHYMCYLRPQATANAIATPEQSLTSPQATKGPIVILGGYSYGSLILKHLPPIPTILQPFASPIVGSSNDEILTRAHKLAEQSNLLWANIARSSKERESRTRRKGHEPKPSVTMGGEETTPEKRRTSRDIRRSTDQGLSAELGNRLRSLSHGHRRCKDDSPPISLQTAERVAITMPEVRYLLISPLTPPISTLAAPALGHKFWNRSKGDCEDVIGLHTTLAIYGDKDTFTSAKRIRDWSEQLKAMSGSQFSSIEVAGAGHFWVESGVEERLRDALKRWEASVR